MNAYQVKIRFIEIYIKLVLLKSYLLEKEEDTFKDIKEVLISFVFIGVRAGKNVVAAGERAEFGEKSLKVGEWHNYGINMGVSVIGSGLSVAGSAIGGAVSGATSSLGGAVSGCLSSLSSTAFTTIGNYGLNMGVNAIRYASGEMSDKEMIQSAISGGISGTISIGASAQTV